MHSGSIGGGGEGLNKYLLWLLCQDISRHHTSEEGWVMGFVINIHIHILAGRLGIQRAASKIKTFRTNKNL